MENRSYLYTESSYRALLISVYYIGLFFMMDVFYKLNQYYLVTPIMLMLVPILNFAYTKAYRNKCTGGYITFSHAWMYSMMLSIFSGIIFAFFLYVYTHYIDKGYIVWFLQTAIHYVEQNIETQPSIAPALNEQLMLLKEMRVPTSIELAMQSFWMIFNIGCFMGIFIALFVKRSEPIK